MYAASCASVLASGAVEVSGYESSQLAIALLVLAGIFAVVALQPWRWLNVLGLGVIYKMTTSTAWAERDRLHIYEIANLSCGKAANDQNVNDEPQASRRRLLKDAIIDGSLRADVQTGAGPDMWAKVSTADLERYLAIRSNSALQAVLEQWKEVRGPARIERLERLCLSGTELLEALRKSPRAQLPQATFKSETQDAVNEWCRQVETVLTSESLDGALKYFRQVAKRYNKSNEHVQDIQNAHQLELQLGGLLAILNDLRQRQ